MNKHLDALDKSTKTDDEPALSSGKPLARLKCNPDDYREDIAEFGFTKEQEDEFLQTLWRIMSTMVDLGWGVESVQYFLPEIFEKTSQDSVNLVGSDSKGG